MIVGFLIFIGIIATLVENVATNNVPHAVTRYEYLAWPLVGILSAILIAGGIWQYVSSQNGVGNTTNSPDFPRGLRERALHNVHIFASDKISEIRDSSHELQMELSNRPGLTQALDTYTVRETAAATLHDSVHRSSMLDFYTSTDHSMLLLGSVGGGKTFQLLNLAERIAQNAASDPDAPIPVVLDLAGWGANPENRTSRKWDLLGVTSPKATPDADSDPLKWLLRQIRHRYGIGEGVARPWLERHKIVLLLDGLDEVPKGNLEACVRWINNLLVTLKAPPCVVSCRSTHIVEAKHLRLSGAVEILPLSRRVTTNYLNSDTSSFAGIRQALAEDEELWELLETPLRLHIMVRIYRRGASANSIEQGIGHADRQMNLIAAYVSDIIDRRRQPDKYQSDHIMRYMVYLAQSAQKNGGSTVPSSTQEEFDLTLDRVGNMGRDILPTAILVFTISAIMRPLSNQIGRLFLVFALLISVPVVLMAIWRSPQRRNRQEAVSRTVMGIVIGIGAGGTIAAFSLGLTYLADSLASSIVRQNIIPFVFLSVNIRALALISLIAKGKWSWWRLGWLLAVSTAFLGPYSYSLGPHKTVAASYAMTTTFMCVFVGFFGAFAFLSLTSEHRSETRNPASLIIGIIIYVMAVLAVPFALPTLFDSTPLAGPGPILAIVSGVTAGFIAAIPLMVFTIIVIISLDSVSRAWAGDLPLRLRAFLSYAAEEGLLIRAGNSYLFEHNLILRYYSQIDRDAI